MPLANDRLTIDISSDTRGLSLNSEVKQVSEVSEVSLKFEERNILEF